MNNISIIGNLTADPELKYSQNNNAYVNFSVGVQRPFKDKQTGEYQSDFPRCKAFGKTAEIIAEHFHKGSKIGLTGSIQTGQFQDQDGKTVYTTDVMVNQVTFIERKQQNNNSYSEYSNQPRQTTGSKPSIDDISTPTLKDDDLPF